MQTELQKLKAKKPDLLETAKNNPAPENLTRHFMFTPVIPGDNISIPVCGALRGGRIKHQMHAVNCPECLANLDAFAALSETDPAAHAAALALCKGLLPEVLVPDPAVIAEKHGTRPSRAAMNHMKAKHFLEQKNAEHPDDLPGCIVGKDAGTFYKNLYEIGLIDEDGKKTGLTAADLAEGKAPDSIEGDPLFPIE